MTGLAATETGGDDVEVVVLVLAAGSTGGIATPFIDAGKPHGDANES